MIINSAFSPVFAAQLLNLSAVTFVFHFRFDSYDPMNKIAIKNN